MGKPRTLHPLFETLILMLTMCVQESGFEERELE